MAQTTAVFSLIVLSTLPVALADTDANAGIVNCSQGQSLAVAVRNAAPGTTLLVKGACSGAVTITQSGLTLQSLGAASVNGNGSDAITVVGATRVTLSGLQVTGGNNGIVGEAGSQLNLSNVMVSGNAQDGILLEGNSSALVMGGGASSNHFNGIELEASSSLIVTGSYAVTGNTVFGIDVNNASSLTLLQAALNVSSNELGLQIGTSSGGFIADSASTLTVTNNATTGLTIVSGAHMVDFGGAITVSGNMDGITVDSKAGLDLDAAALVQSYNNKGDGVHLEETSVLTMFNTPAFSGAPGTTTLNVYGNSGNGINVLTGSGVTLINQALISSTNNALAGISVDDASRLTLIGSTVTGNHPDIALSFGSHATLNQNVSIGSVTCDATVLVRGDAAIVCPSGATKSK